MNSHLLSHTGMVKDTFALYNLKKKKNSDASVYKSYLFTSVAKKVPTFTKPTAEYDRSQKESSMNSSES